MHDWLSQLRTINPAAHGIGLLCLVAASGLVLGRVRIGGVGLGVAGVLFAGILFGEFAQPIDANVRGFLQEFGLILFVYTIGTQLGPGFAASMRRDGLRMNLLAALIIVCGALTAVGLAFLLKVDMAACAGLYAGATTNTPALGTTQQVLSTLSATSTDRAAIAGQAYAVAYPMGILGIVGSMLVLKALFRIDVKLEAERYTAGQRSGVEPIERMTIVLENPELDGVTLSELPFRRFSVTVSRVKGRGEDMARTARDDTPVRRGDVLLAIGTRRDLEDFRRCIGRAADMDLLTAPSRVLSSRVVVTHTDVLGKPIGELALEQRFAVRVTRATRADMEMTDVLGLRLRYGDMITLVGEKESIDQAAAVLGNSLKALGDTHLIPVFLGIGLGVLGGMMPLSIPGLPVPLRLGLAGGPLILAIMLSRIGHIGKLVWSMPASANLAFRELGITLFLACVGLKAGEGFFARVLTMNGLLWLCVAAIVSAMPLLLVGALARSWLKMNFHAICGLLAGSTTDPPALAFAGSIARCDAPAVAYAAVYPLAMLLRIVSAQIIVIVLC